MNKELQAIENTIMQWIFYVVTGAKNKWSYEPIRDANLLDNCYLCEHSSGITGTRECRDFSDDSRHPRCQACPYFKKYGFCCDSGKPVEMWADDHNPMHAQAFLDQLKVLAYEAQHPEPKKTEKPKLRHGDYGRDSCLSGKHGDPRIYANGHSWGCVGEVDCDATPLKFVYGNIFKELAALKPIKEFEMKDCTGGNDFKARINCNGHVELRAGCGLVTVNDREFHEIILKLRCMELRKIQDAAKQ